MNVLQLTLTYHPSLNGVAITSKNIHEGLKKEGHFSFVLAPRLPHYQESDPAVCRLPSLPNPLYPPYPLLLTLPTPPAVRFLVSQSFDIIHTRHPFLIGRLSQMISHWKKAPLVFSYHSRYDLKTHFFPSLFKKEVAAWILERTIKFCNSCRAVVAESESLKNFLVESGVKTPVQTIPSGIATSMKSNYSKEELKKRIGLSPNDFVILGNSRLSLREKNLAFLFDVFEKLAPKFKNMKFVLVSDGPDRKKLENLALQKGFGHQVKFFGFIPQEKLPNYYGGADVFVHSSLNETQGLVFAEALSAGLPVVALRAPGAVDVIKDGDNGLLASTAEDFYQKIVELYQSADLRESLRQKAMTTATSYTVEKSVRRLIELYQSLIKDGRR